MISKETAEHFVWGENCDGWHLVNNADLSVICERMPPGTFEVRHYHTKARQFFFILSGVATLEIGGKREVLQKHQGAEVAPNLPHQMFNDSDEEIEFIIVSHPSSHGDRVITD